MSKGRRYDLSMPGIIDALSWTSYLAFCNGLGGSPQTSRTVALRGVALIRIYWPGSESPEGFLVSFNLPHPTYQGYNNNYLGLAFYVVVEFIEFPDLMLEVYCESFYRFPYGDL
ncbi:hypothetical protein L484_012148 [Morus notabilis]|uniref:Uncharacterized protein n=1 Tax=Morus notabilis TaxID=981085 RepID=W9RVZ8_9ROSA|nr:hypothetical protein L484_012148 [Morus notabilis]